MAEDLAHRRKLEQKRARAARARIAEIARELGKDPDHCVRCGKGSRGKGSLHWHHVDPTTKLFAIGDTRNYGRSDAEKRAELEKCERICKTCHYYGHSLATDAGPLSRGPGKGYVVRMNFPTAETARRAQKLLADYKRSLIGA